MLLRSSLVKIARRNCHHFTPDNPLPRTVLRSIPDSLSKQNELMNTVQKQQQEIRELNNKLAKLSTNMHERMQQMDDDIRLGYSLSCILVVFSVAMRS
jgi:hypothetical protein